MGLKLKKFRAKLNVKPKKVVNEVVCLKYQINSEFQEPAETSLSEATSIPKTVLQTREVIKQKKSAPKLSIQNVFDGYSNGQINTSKANGTLKPNENNPATSTIMHGQPRGILKKGDLYCAKVKDTNISATKHNVTDEDDKKSVLIFMTENHDNIEDTTASNIDTNKTEILPITSQDGNGNTNYRIINIDQQAVELRIKNNLDEQKKLHITQNTLSNNNNENNTKIEASRNNESELVDVKSVRWRETVIEIKPNIQYDINDSQHSKDDNSIDDFKFHHTNQQFSTDKLNLDEDSESASEEDSEEAANNKNYGSRGTYSSQAASIFFQGEEPGPALRI